MQTRLKGFTFHYVSISTDSVHSGGGGSLPFTFHYVSISTEQEINEDTDILHLHSTMYLFQPESLSEIRNVPYYLHSTMYLFQPVRNVRVLEMPLFTFHYVSISTLIST